MATMLSPSTAPHEPLPRELAGPLAALRRRVSFWFAVESGSRVLWTLLASVLVSFVLDFGFHLDYSQRSFLLIVGVIGVVLTLLYRVGKTWRSTLSDDALLLEVERHNPELHERLITAAQFSRWGSAIPTHASHAMVAASIREGLAAARQPLFENVINYPRFTRNAMLLASAVLISGGLIFAGVQGAALVRIWFERNVLLRTVSWPQNTYLEIEGVTSGVLYVPRGDDCALLVRATPNSRVIPERVTLEFRDGRPALGLKRTGDSQFETVLPNIIQPFEFRVKGGDEITEYIRVKLVEPPGFESLALRAIMPKYAGGATVELPPGKGPYFLLPGSRLRISGKTNKPLKSAFAVSEHVRAALDISNQRDVAGELAADQLRTGSYQLELTDADGLTAKRPLTFGLKLRPDREPRVRARLTGIGGMVTPRANLPLTGRATDDYGLAQVFVEIQWQSETDNKSGRGEIPLPEVKLAGAPLDVPLQGVVALEPLAIPTGSRLQLFGVATDFDDYQEEAAVAIPNRGRTPEISLRVVTDDELRGDLLRREKEQRQEFERLVKLQADLVTFCRELNAQWGQKEELGREQRDRFQQLAKQQKLIGGNCASVLARLSGVLEEIQNNRLEDAAGPLVTRLRTKIVEPLGTLQETGFPTATQHLETVRRATGDFAAKQSALAPALAATEQIERDMRVILDQMSQAEGFQEAVNLLFELQKAQQEVLDRTKKIKEERQKEIFRDSAPKVEPPAVPGAKSGA